MNTVYTEKFTAFDRGQEAYDNQRGDYYPPRLRNSQLYPQQFLDGWEHAAERHWERENLHD